MPGAADEAVHDLVRALGLKTPGYPIRRLGHDPRLAFCAPSGEVTLGQEETVGSHPHCRGRIYDQKPLSLTVRFHLSFVPKYPKLTSFGATISTSCRKPNTSGIRS